MNIIKVCQSLTQLLRTQTYQAIHIFVTIGGASSHINKHTCSRTSDFSFISPRGIMVKMFKMTEVTWQSYLQYTYYRRRSPLGNPRIKHFAQGHLGLKELFSSWITRVFQRLPVQIFNHHSTKLDLLLRRSSLTFTLSCLLRITTFTLQSPTVAIQCPLVCTL